MSAVANLPWLVAQAALSDCDSPVAPLLAPRDKSVGRTGVMFFKPEAVALGSDGLSEATEYLLLAARDHGIQVRTVHVVNGRAALQRRYIQKNYQLIHRAALQMSPVEELDTTHWPWPRVGALRLRGSGLDPAKLLSHWRGGIDNVRKLGNDCYGMPIELAGKTFVLLNGFYPHQLAAYAAPAARLVVFTFDASRPLERLKQEFQGDADPRVASAWSVRARLRQISQRIGGPDMWTSQNGFHMSANPIEADQELGVFFGCFPEALR